MAREGRRAEAVAAFEGVLGAYRQLTSRQPDDVQSRLFSVVPLWRLAGLETALAILKPLAAIERLDANRIKWVRSNTNLHKARLLVCSCSGWY